MGVYGEWIVPALIDLSMRNKRLWPYRARVAGAAEGRVLDVGVGSGLNLPFYPPRVRDIFGLDPSPRLLARAPANGAHAQCPVHLIQGSAESIPLADRLQHSRGRHGTARDATRAQDRGTLAVRRAWARPGAGRCPLAGPPRPLLAWPFRRVSPEPQDRRSLVRCRFSSRSVGDRIHSGPEDHDIPVRRSGKPAVTIAVPPGATARTSGRG
jgi:SAM-dependent methyltransferase